VLSLALASCATRPAPDSVAPLRLDPAACVTPAAAPKLPDGAGVPVAVTPEERVALSLFLNWTAQVVDWGKALADRQAKTAASTACTS